MVTTSNWAAEASAARRVHGSVRLPTGMTLPYVEQGSRDGTPVIFLHGYTDSWRSFEPVLPHLPGGLRAFVLTQRGHGDATRPAGGYRPADFASDVAAFMDSAGLRKAVIAGHSMGAEIAQRFALDYPERTQALVLLGAFFAFEGHAGVNELRAEVSRLSDPVDVQFVRGFQESTLAQAVPPGFFDLVVSESCKLPARVWQAVLDGLMTSRVAAQRGKIARPTLLVAGAVDAFVTADDQQRLCQAIPGAELLTYARAGHAMHWEEPARFAADLAAFVRRVEAA